MSEWRDIRTYDPQNDPPIVLVAYECGHVTAAEYSERCVGGPDDHQTWEAYIPPRNEARYLFEAWPSHWMPYPKAPK